MTSRAQTAMIPIWTSELEDFLAADAWDALQRVSGLSLPTLLVGGTTDPMTPPTYRALIEEPQSNALIAAGPTGTIVRSTDDGVSWTEVLYTPFNEAEAFTDLLMDSTHHQLIAVEADGRHYASDMAVNLGIIVSLIAASRCSICSMLI